MHRQVHHCERPLSLEREELVLGDCDVVAQLVPGSDHTAANVTGRGPVLEQRGFD